MLYGTSRGVRMTSIAGNVRARGVATQTRILERAVHIASVEGLSQMSLATLARATSMSKSGLFAHFRSKEALQLAIIDEADRMFRGVVHERASGAPAGMPRLWALASRYVEYCAGDTFEGGCFFAAAVHEFDSKPGPIRDRVVRFVDEWNGTIAEAASGARDLGHVVPDVDMAQLTFEVTGIGLSTNWSTHLFPERQSGHAAGMRAMAGLMQRIATPAGANFLPEAGRD